jgi:flagellar basal body-associated protein FliL
MQQLFTSLLVVLAGCSMALAIAAPTATSSSTAASASASTGPDNIDPLQQNWETGSTGSDTDSFLPGLSPAAKAGVIVIIVVGVIGLIGGVMGYYYWKKREWAASTARRMSVLITKGARMKADKRESVESNVSQDLEMGTAKEMAATAAKNADGSRGNSWWKFGRK